MKRKTATILLIAIFLISTLMVSGCSLITDKVGEKATEKVVENAMQQGGGKDAKVDIKNAEWPKSIPSDVPKLPSGKITMTAENSVADGKTTMVYYEGVGPAAGDNYKGALEQAGWKITMSNKSSDGTSMIIAEKDKRSVNLVLAADSNNSSKGISGWVAYTEKTN